MKTYRVIALGAAAALSICGCVPKAQYDEAMAANRRINMDLQNAQASLRTMKGEKDVLEANLQNAEARFKAKDQEAKLLEASKKNLQASLDDIAAKYAEMLKGGQPGELGKIKIALPALVDEALKKLAAENPDLMEYLPEYGMIKLKADLTFAPGDDTVQASAKEAMVKFAEIINSPQASKFNIFIAGHTDDLPIVKANTKRRHPDNLYLSVHRAVAVAQELVGASVAPARMCAMGFGEYHPIEPNKPGHKGNKANRRVEIWIVAPDRFLTAPSAAPAAAE